MKHLLPAFSICLAVSILASCNPSDNSRVKIIGGTPVDETDPIAPHVAGLFDGHGSLSCTVAAISPSVFITAAHCVYKRDLNGWTIKTGINAEAEILDVDTAIAHEDFTPAMLYSMTPSAAPNDIALIKTTSPSASAIPVPIIRGITISKISLPFEVTIAGYGRIDAGDPASKGTLQKTIVLATKLNAPTREFTTENGAGKMACHGDSGGPAFYQSGKTLTLIGTVSRGDSPCARGATVFTAITEFESFITAGLSKLNSAMN